ncbi:MAG: DUF4296 domain-containing protein [Bacteroidota bacterium]
MKKFARKFILMFGVMLVLFACNRSREKLDKPDNIIPKDKLVSVLVDIHKVDGLLVSKVVDVQEYSKAALYHSVFNKYDVDEDSFNNTIRYYTVNDIESLNEVYDEVLAVLNEEQAVLTQKLK